MRSIDNQLATRICNTLADLSWQNNFRIHPGAGGFALNDSFIDCGFDVVPNDSTGRINFGYKFKISVFPGQRIDYFTSEILYSDIFRPNKDEIPTSPHAYNEAIIRIFGNLRSFNQNEGSFTWNFQRERLKSCVLGIFRTKLRKLFSRYQENMLVSVDGRIDNLDKPNLLQQLTQEEGLEPLRKILERQVDTDSEDQIDYSEQFERAMDNYIGRYLSMLADIKGYEPLDNGMDVDPYNYFAQRQTSGFKKAEVLKWNITSAQEA